MRRTRLTIAIVALAAAASAQDNPQAGKDKKVDKSAESLADQIKQSDLVIVGKVTQTGLSAASSFDVGIIEASDVLKGDAKIKSVKFRFASSGGGNIAPYGKKGVEGVWVLSKVGKADAPRGVLAFLALQDLKLVREIMKKQKDDQK